MITVKRLSAWKYDTSASGGVAVGIVALEGGAIYFQDPNGLSRKFRYGGLGASLSWGLKIPKMPKIQIKGKSAGGAAAPASFPSRGALLVTNRCPGDDLVKKDIQGACAFIDGGGGRDRRRLRRNHVARFEYFLRPCGRIESAPGDGLMARRPTKRSRYSSLYRRQCRYSSRTGRGWFHWRGHVTVGNPFSGLGIHWALDVRWCPSSGTPPRDEP